MAFVSPVSLCGAGRPALQPGWEPGDVASSCRDHAGLAPPRPGLPLAPSPQPLPSASRTPIPSSSCDPFRASAVNLSPYSLLQKFFPELPGQVLLFHCLLYTHRTCQIRLPQLFCDSLIHGYSIHHLIFYSVCPVTAEDTPALAHLCIRRARRSAGLDRHSISTGLLNQ